MKISKQEKIETPEDSEARTEIEEEKALDSTEEESDLEQTEKVTIAEESRARHFLHQNQPRKSPLLSVNLESPYIPDQAPKSTDRWKEQVHFGLG